MEVLQSLIRIHKGNKDMKIINIFGDKYSGKTVMIKILSKQITEQLPIKILIIGNTTEKGEDYAYSLPSGETTVDSMRPFMVSGIIPKDSIDLLKLKINQNIDLIRGSEISSLERDSLSVLINNLDGYDMILLENEYQYNHPTHETLNVKLLNTIERKLKEEFKKVSPEVTYVISRPPEQNILPKGFKALEFLYDEELVLASNGYEVQLLDDTLDFIDNLIDILITPDEFGALESNDISNTANKKSFKNKMRILGR